MIHELNPWIEFRDKEYSYQSSDETKTDVPVFQVHFSDREQY